MTGRGAWPANGAGGTKKYKDATKPGSYYYLGTGKDNTNANEYAVRQAVKAYQRALNRRLNTDLRVDGRFGTRTSEAVLAFQHAHPECGTPWGGIGPDTSKAVLLPDLVAETEAEKFKHPNWVSGTINTESFWDAGAVGYLDDSDLGLAQINGPAHPTLSEKERLRPKVAYDFIIKYYKSALANLKDDDLAIASYNLGQGGARVWDKAGRPDIYVPPGASRPRDVRAYINRIKAG